MEIPNWLTQQEKYVPKKDSVRFADKSILSMIAILSGIRTQDGRRNIVSVDTAFSIAGTLLFLILLSLSKSLSFLLIMGVGLLFCLCFLPAEKIARVVKAIAFTTLLSFLILLPSYWITKNANNFLLLLKIVEAVFAVLLLAQTTSWSHISSGLKVFFLSDLFLWVFDITVRYICLLGNAAVELLYALRLRCVGKSERRYDSLSGIFGTLFLHSKEMAEEAHSAMTCRGFTGTYRRPHTLFYPLGDTIYTVILAGIFVSFFYFERV